MKKTLKLSRHPDGARKTAWRILLQWEAGGDAVETIRERVLRSGDLGRKDTSLVMELTQGTLRNLLFLDHTIRHCLDKPDRPLPEPVVMAIRLGVYQLLYLHGIPAHAAVDQSVRLVGDSRFKGFAPLVNAILRKVAREGHAPIPPFSDDPVGHLELSTSTPRWLVEKLVDQEGVGEAHQILQALNRTPALTLRVNSLLTSRDRLMAELTEAGIAVKPGKLAPTAIVMGDRRSPVDLLPFGAGMCTVQDEGAQLIAPLLSPRPGDMVLDACAAPGGKTGHLAQILGGDGRVVAADRSFGRAELIRETIARMRLPGISIVVADLSPETIPFAAERFDRVLLDAPCSGTGVLSRHPEGKWRKNPGAIIEMARTQTRLLAAVTGTLKPGGRLLYTTCSLLTEENEEVVDRHLADGNCSLVDLRKEFPEQPGGVFTGRGELRLWPHRHRCDGFYGALLKKNG